MKALTNILTRLLLLLLLMLVACTEDVAEVDDLVRGEEYVQVRMQVPDMKSANTRATADDNITSIVALVFREDKLISKTEVTTAAYTLNPTSTTTGTFNLPRPKDGDVIHFLANLPEGYDLSSVDEKSDLTSLTTDNPSQLSYWGMATYNGGDVIDNVTLYRNMAKIEIAAGPDCTFPEDQLFIAGLMKPNGKGTLVPYKNGFNFDLDYYTLPTELPTRFNNEFPTPVTSVYLFEHDNPGTADGLFIICLIGKDYYRVALIDDETGQPYDIIRNHRYVIYVNDLDEGADRFDDATEDDPINFDVIEYKDVTLTIAEQNISLPYSNTAQEEVTLSVTVPIGVQSLSVSADGFMVTSGDSKMTYDNGVYRINNTSTEQTVRFKLRLNNDATIENATITISGIGVNEFVTVTDATTTISTTLYSTNVANEQTLWLGTVSLDNTDNQTQIPVSYSLFFDGNETQVMPEGSKLFIEYEGSGGWIQAATPGNWDSLPGLDAGNSIIVTITDEVLTQIREQHNGDVAFYVQGNEGKTLKKIYLVRANGAITATKANDNPLYHNVDNQSITVTAIVPEGVSTLYITAPDFNFNGDTYGDYTYALNGETTVQLEFTLKQDVNETTKTSTIKFSGDYVSSTTIDVEIAEKDLPDVSITSTSSPTLYWNDGISTTSFDVTVSVPELEGCSLDKLIITADGFTIKQDGDLLGTNSYSYTDENSLAAGKTITYTFTPTSTGNDKTITFSGSGTMVDVYETSFTIDVPTITASVDDNKTELYYNVENQTVTVTANIPSGVSAISIEATDFSVDLNNGNGGTFDDNTNTFTCNGATTAVFVFKLNSGIESEKTSTITFKDATEGNSNKVGSKSVIIDLIEQSTGGDEPGGVIWSMKNLTITPSYQEIKRLKFNDEGISKLAPNLYLGILFREIDNQGHQFFIKKYSSTQSNGEGDRLTGTANLYNATGRKEILLTETNVSEILDEGKGNGVSFWGSPDVTIYEIYISTVPIIE